MSDQIFSILNQPKIKKIQSSNTGISSSKACVYIISVQPHSYKASTWEPDIIPTHLSVGTKPPRILQESVNEVENAARYICLHE